MWAINEGEESRVKWLGEVSVNRYSDANSYFTSTINTQVCWSDGCINLEHWIPVQCLVHWMNKGREPVELDGWQCSPSNRVVSRTAMADSPWQRKVKTLSESFPYWDHGTKTDISSIWSQTRTSKWGLMAWGCSVNKVRTSLSDTSNEAIYM